MPSVCELKTQKKKKKKLGGRGGWGGGGGRYFLAWPNNTDLSEMFVLFIDHFKEYSRGESRRRFTGTCIRSMILSVFMYYTVCYFIGISYAVVRQISMLFIDNKISVFCK